MTGGEVMEMFVLGVMVGLTPSIIVYTLVARRHGDPLWPFPSDMRTRIRRAWRVLCGRE